ncbi:MAG: Rieske 2Fe-2S domain-containing protein [Gammaproteobacteria bacterium]
MLKALGVSLTWPLLPAAEAATDDPKTMRPQIGDRLVFMAGDKKEQMVKPEDLALGGPQQLFYPMDPGSKTIRDGSGTNLVMLIRFDPADLNEEMTKIAAEGVIAYSGMCTHQGCPVSMWKADTKVLYCSCHGSEYDPRDRAKVVGGPAPKRLANLPIKLEDGYITVAGEFTGKVGFKPE